MTAGSMIPADGRLTIFDCWFSFVAFFALRTVFFSGLYQLSLFTGAVDTLVITETEEVSKTLLLARSGDVDREYSKEYSEDCS